MIALGVTNAIALVLIFKVHNFLYQLIDNFE